MLEQGVFAQSETMIMNTDLVFPAPHGTEQLWLSYNPSVKKTLFTTFQVILGF